MILIGICGKLGVGKDYITTHVVKSILKNRNYLQLAFADQIKINVMTKSGLSYDDLYVNKTDVSRRLLQVEGTNGRNENTNIWINYLDNWATVQSRRGVEYLIISDCRYKNEFEYIKKNDGILIKVIAPDRNNDRLVQEASSSGVFDNEIFNKIKNHSSECDLDDMPDKNFDIIIDNSKKSILNIDELQECLFEKISYRHHNFLYRKKCD